MIKYAITIALLIFLTSCHQYQDNSPQLISINLVDKNGFTETISSKDRLTSYRQTDFSSPQPYDKVVRVYSKDEKGWTKSYLHAYHPNGQPRQYLEAVNSRASGVYREWHQSGQLKLEAHVLGGLADLAPAAQETWLFDGPCKAFDDEGFLLALVPYEKGVLNGQAITYHKNGTIAIKEPFSEGKLDGQYEVFDDKGELLQSIHYEEDLKDGDALLYVSMNDEKRLMSFETYHKGWLKCGTYHAADGHLLCEVIDGDGERAVFNNQTLKEIQEIQNGRLDGKVTVYLSGSIPSITYHVKNGVKQGEELQYYVAKGLQSELRGQSPVSPKLSVHWFEGAIQGVVKTWYDNGHLESQREMSQNKKNGLSTAWYRDGGLMLIEEYQNDLLINGEYFKRGERLALSKITLGKGLASLFDSEGGFKQQVAYRDGKPLEK